MPLCAVIAAILLCIAIGSVSASSPGYVVSDAGQTFELQPGPGLNDGTDDGSADRGKDTSVWESYSGTNYGALANAWLFKSNCNDVNANGYIRFSMDGMPTENIESAEIQTYNQVYFNGAGWPWQIDPVVAVRQVTSDWDEMAMVWGNQPAFDPAVLDSRQVDTVGGGSGGNPYIEYEGWLSYNITDLYRSWVSGTPNHGVRFSIENPTCPNGDMFIYYTSDYATDPSLRPRLVVKVAAPPSPQIASIQPSSGVQGRIVPITNLAGTGFQPGAKVNLTRTGSPNIAMSGVGLNAAGTSITGSFNLAGAAAGIWDLSVTNPDGQSATRPGAFTIISSAPQVTGIQPNTGYNTGTMFITNLAGTGFVQGAKVNLTKTGRPNVSATGVTVVSSQKMTFSLNLKGVTTGNWNVVVTNPDGQSGMLPNGFSITAKQPATGTVTVKSVPTGANVYIDDLYRGKTPFTVKNLIPGAHTVRVTKPGYQDYSVMIAIVGAKSNIGVVAPLKKI